MVEVDGFIGTIAEDDEVPVADESSESEDEVSDLICVAGSSIPLNHVSLCVMNLFVFDILLEIPHYRPTRVATPT